MMKVYSNTKQCAFNIQFNINLNIQHYVNVQKYKSSLKSLSIKESSLWMFACKADEFVI